MPPAAAGSRWPGRTLSAERGGRPWLVRLERASSTPSPGRRCTFEANASGALDSAVERPVAAERARKH
eukprot:7707180-Alexandrium_andersonii.AAC.1